MPIDGSVAAVRQRVGRAGRPASDEASVALRKPTLDDVFLPLTSGGAR